MFCLLFISCLFKIITSDKNNKISNFKAGIANRGVILLAVICINMNFFRPSVFGYPARPP